MDFKLEISTESRDADIKEKCLEAVAEVLKQDGQYFGVGYATKEGKRGFTESEEPKTPSQEGRARKVVVEGVMNFSFGKNGQGLTNELVEIGDIVKTLSKDNHVFIEDAFIDACDDVYDLKFRITPHAENEWMLKKNAFTDKKDQK